jgi:hypothetical protein
MKRLYVCVPPHFTLQFTAARLLKEYPEIRTFADDLESFMLVYLWCAARYAPNNMTPLLRGQALQRFDSQNIFMRIALLAVGRATAYQYELSSQYLYHVLWRICGFSKHIHYCY